MKKILKIQFTFIILTVLLLVSIVNSCIFYLLAPGPLTENKILIITPKLSINQIIAKLTKEKIINYSVLFKCMTKISSLRYIAKSGEYMFTTNISPVQVLRILFNGQSIIHKIVIPEGTMVSEIIKRINDEKRLIGEIKEVILEGSLMPSTYFFSYGDQKEQIINQMRKLMSSNLDKAMENLSPDSPLKTRLEVLTLASIVEKEALFNEEKPMIAAVFLNRLKKNIKLQADPTAIYAITEGKFKLKRPLTKKDLIIPSLYNTYYTANLPAGPIACPGQKSLESVVNPAKINALYFVADGKGAHNFSNNLNEHNKHVRNYHNRLSIKINN